MPETQYGLLVWDFDGTLADTLGSALEVYNVMAEKYGFERIEDPESVRTFTARKFIRHHKIPILRLPSLIREYLRIQNDRMEEIELNVGILDSLLAMKDHGVRHGIISSNSQENISVCLQANKVENLFDFVIGYPRLFGKSRAIKRRLKAEKVTNDSVLYVGDEIRDIEAAKKANIDVAAVTWGFNTADSLAEHAPTYLVHDPQTLTQHVLHGSNGIGIDTL
ncbi:MAG: HAD-IA family hydrolase [Gemmataceae bacterium]